MIMIKPKRLPLSAKKYHHYININICTSIFIISLVTIFNAQGSEQDDVWIVNARIHTMTNTGIVEGHIRVRDGIIKDITSQKPPVGISDSNRIDAQGRPVTPGLFDSGSMIGLLEVDLSTSAKDQVYKGESMSASFDVAMAFNEDSSLIPIYRNEGISHAFVRPGPGTSPLAGLGSVVQLSQNRRPGSPKAIVQSGNAVFVYLGERGRNLASESRTAALQILLSGLREAKLYDDHPVAYRYRQLREFELLQEDLAALAEVLKRKKKLVLHIDRASEIRNVLQTLDTYELDIVLSGAAEAWKVADELAKRNIPVIINVLNNIPANFDRMGSRLDQAALLQKAGVRFAFMTDDLFTETRLLTQAAGVAVAYGLAWRDALKAITIQPAAIWGLSDRLGSLEEGKEAHLVIWSGDPFELSTTVDAMMIHGNWMDLNTRQIQLKDRYLDIDKSAPPMGYR